MFQMETRMVSAESSEDPKQHDGLVEQLLRLPATARLFRSSCAALRRSSARMAYSSTSLVATGVASCLWHETEPLLTKTSSFATPMPERT